jgi:hypothetical protein
MADGGVRFTIDGAALAELLRGPDGPVVQHLIRRADAVIVKARSNIRGHTDGPLANSIVKRPGMSEAGPYYEVIAGLGLPRPYAFWYHSGNAESGGRIYPKNGQFLVFKSTKGKYAGHMIFVKSVKAWPGNPFLSRALDEVMAADV